MAIPSSMNRKDAITDLRDYAEGNKKYSNGYAAIAMARERFEGMCQLALKRIGINKVAGGVPPSMPEGKDSTDPFSFLEHTNDPDIDAVIQSANEELQDLIAQALNRNAIDAVAKLEQYAKHHAGYPNTETAIRFACTAIQDTLSLGCKCTINFPDLVDKIERASTDIGKREGFVAWNENGSIVLRSSSSITTPHKEFQWAMKIR